MIQDITERFSYRFQLWRRQEPPALFGVQRARTADIGAKLEIDPKRKVVLKEPTPMFIAGAFVSYFVPVGVVAIISRVFIAFFPTTRLGIIIGFFAFACVWGAAAIQVFANLNSARKDRRNEDTDHLTPSR